MGKHLERAEILIEQHRYDLAEVSVRQEIAENPDSTRGHSTLALCLINQGKFAAETLESIDYALSLDVEDDWHHYLLALYWCHRCNFERARLALDVAIELDPNSEHYFYLLAFILCEQGENKFQNKYLSFFNLAFINESYFIRSDLQPVFIPIERSLALNPEYLPTLNLLTRLLITTGRNRQALKNSRSALSIDPNDEDAHNLHGQILTKCSKYSAAVESFRSALRIDPTLESARLGLLEAMRSQYWIYRWVSATNWRGRLLLFFLFPFLPITLKIAAKHLARCTDGRISIHMAVLEIFLIILLLLIPVLIVWSFIAIPVGVILAVLVDRNIGIGLILVVVLSTIVTISYPAQWIFNLFLQLDRENKLLLSLSDLIIASYVAGLTMTLWISIDTYLAMSIYQIPDRKMVISILGIVGGIFTTIGTFLPLYTQRYRHILSSGSIKMSICYQLGVSILGAIGIGIYLHFGTLGIFGYILITSIKLAPVIANFIVKN